jgi:hypothetical protein
MNIHRMRFEMALKHFFFFFFAAERLRILSTSSIYCHSQFGSSPNSLLRRFVLWPRPSTGATTGSGFLAESSSGSKVVFNSRGTVKRPIFMNGKSGGDGLRGRDDVGLHDSNRYVTRVIENIGKCGFFLRTRSRFDILREFVVESGVGSGKVLGRFRNAARVSGEVILACERLNVPTRQSSKAYDKTNEVGK